MDDVEYENSQEKQEVKEKDSDNQVNVLAHKNFHKMTFIF